MKILLGGTAVLLILASAMLWMLRPGARLVEGGLAPDFVLPDQTGRIHRLADYAGRWLVLYFYPRDDTPLCTQEACRFRDDIGVYGDLGAAIVGVSVDDRASHAAFASRSAVAGATTTRSACCPIRTCGTWSTPVHTSLATDLPESAAQVGAPTNSRAAAVGTTVTS